MYTFKNSLKECCLNRSWDKLISLIKSGAGAMHQEDSQRTDNISLIYDQPKISMVKETPRPLNVLVFSFFK